MFPIVDVADVVESVVDLVDANCVSVVADYRKADLRLFDGEREADIAETDNAYFKLIHDLKCR